MKKTLLRLVAALFFAGATTAASAGPVITGYTGGGGPFTAYYTGSSGDAVGFQFKANVNLTVTAFGILVDPSDGVIDSAHQVGLWHVSDQALLGSASVDNTGTELDGFIYASLISGISLIAGEEYVLAAVYAIGDSDNYLSAPTTLTTDGISMTAGVAPGSADLGLTFPSLVSAGNLARLGPNMIANAVPEPGALALLGLGLAGLAASRRSKQ